MRQDGAPKCNGAIGSSALGSDFRMSAGSPIDTRRRRELFDHHPGPLTNSSDHVLLAAQSKHTRHYHPEDHSFCSGQIIEVC